MTTQRGPTMSRTKQNALGVELRRAFTALANKQEVASLEIHKGFGRLLIFSAVMR